MTAITIVVTTMAVRWGHKHHHHHRGSAVVYAPARYYAPAPVYYGPPAAVYQPNYYVPRSAPALTIGVSPIVIPLH